MMFVLTVGQMAVGVVVVGVGGHKGQVEVSW